MKRLSLLFLLAGLLSAHPLVAADWPMFRGPNLNGVADQGTAPTIWSEDENVLWKANLPSAGNGSPIVSQGHVYITAFNDSSGKERSLLCFDEKTGQQLWSRTVEIDREMPTHKTNPHAPTTPAADQKNVVVWHGSAGIHCYDHNGKTQWSHDLGEYRHMWGYGSSPIIVRDKVLLHTGPGSKVFVIAFDLKTGEEIWRVEEPQQGTGERNDSGEYMGSWSTPVLIEENGHTTAVVVHSTRVVSYNIETGSILWFCEGVGHDRGDLAYSSPVIHNQICFLTGGFQGPAMAIKLGGSGNVTATHLLWREERQPQSIGSGVCVDGYVYRPNAGPGTLECIDINTGEVRWKDRAAGTQWSSVIMANNLLYATGQDARTTIFKPNSNEFELVTQNQLPGHTNATPAIANGRLFIRTNDALWCIGN